MGRKSEPLKIVLLRRDHFENHYPDYRLPWQVYHTVRNALVRTCRRFGPTGPMGIVKIVADFENPYLMLAEDPGFWKRGDKDPVYYLLDDQLNHERYCYMEVLGEDTLDEEWMLAIAETLQEFEGWGLILTNIPKSTIIIFAKRILVKGKVACCKTLEELADKANHLLNNGDKKWWQFWK